MSVYLNQIEQLVDLQKVDNSIHEITTELTEAPRELDVLQERFSAFQGQRDKIEEKIAHILEQQKRIAFDIEEDVSRIKKSRNKLTMVTNQREHHAVMREMDNMEKLNRSREEEKMAMADELVLQEDALAEVDKDYLYLKAELEVKNESLQSRIEEAQAKLQVLEGVRSNTGAGVPQPVFQRYEFIRNRLEHPVIVPVSEGICSGCHIAIPPQSFIELQRGQQILSCPNCQRLIYWCEHFKAPEVEAEVAKPEIFIANPDA